MGSFIDLTGKRFGYLTVIKRVANNQNGHVCWLCQCDCGNTHITITYNLTHGLCRSCGCLNKNRNLYNNIYNRYDLDRDYGIGFTSKNEKFYFDLEDYDVIKQIGWCYNSDGYVVGNITINGKQKRIAQHRLIMNCPPDMVIDHINGVKSDNRKCNLRICTVAQNAYNASIQKRNKLNAKGVSITHCNTYQAQIQVNGKLKYLGSYKTIKEAADAYDIAAKKYFGEYAKLNNYINTE